MRYTPASRTAGIVNSDPVVSWRMAPFRNNTSRVLAGPLMRARRVTTVPTGTASPIAMVRSPSCAVKLRPPRVASASITV